MAKYLSSFVKSESGAVTVDWVVLTAAIVAMTLGVFFTLANSSSNIATNISTYIADMADD